MDYYGSYIPNHIRLTQPHGERRHAGPADKAVLEEMRRRNNIEKAPKNQRNSAQRGARHCTIITAIEHSGRTATRYCLTHNRTFLSGNVPARCPAAREVQEAAL